MGELDNRVNITIQIQDVTVTRAGFGTLAIVHEHGQGALNRVETYSSLEALVAVFPVYTPVGKYASLFFSQAFVAEEIKVIKREAAETVTAALTAAALVDPDWYAIGVPGDVSADHQSAASYALSNKKLYLYSSQEADAITSATTDVFSVLQAASNNRAAGWFSKTAGLEFEINTLTVAGTTCTAAVTGTPVVAVGDTVGIWDSATTALNSTWTVLTVGASDFTFTVPSGTASDLTTSNAWVNFNLIDAAISGKMLPLDAGSRTWDIQNLAGVIVDGRGASTATVLTDTEKGFLADKNGNWFAEIAGVNVTSGPKPGGGGKLASGRYIDVQRGADWLEANLQADLFQLMVNEGGNLGYDAIGFQKVESTIAARLDDGLDKEFLTPFTSGQFAGQNYNIAMPNLADIPQADKTNRLLSGIEISAQIRGKIHNIEATVTLST